MLGRLEDWKIGYRFIQPSSLPSFQQQLPVLKIKIDYYLLFSIFYPLLSLFSLLLTSYYLLPKKQWQK